MGFSFTWDRVPKRRIAPQAVLRFKARVRELTRRTRGISIERMTDQLSVYFRGWIGYFGACETPSVLRGLDEWVRRRLRSAMLVLDPIFEADLPPEQYAYRQGRNAQQAVIDVEETLFRGHSEVVDADLADYYASLAGHGW